jgi:hypothetical protein
LADATGTQEQTFDELDLAVELIEDAKAQTETRREASNVAERRVRDWWAARDRSA